MVFEVTPSVRFHPPPTPKAVLTDSETYPWVPVFALTWAMCPPLTTSHGLNPSLCIIPPLLFCAAPSIRQRGRSAAESSTSCRYREPAWSSPPLTAGAEAVTGQVQTSGLSLPTRTPGCGHCRSPWLNTWVPRPPPEGTRNVHA